jgi:ribonuclease HI
VRLTLYFDGAAFPNAKDVGGERGIGVVLEDETGVVKEISEKLPGLGSSNSAEYMALIRGLEEARRLGADEVLVRGDSQLVIRQLEGKFRVASDKIKPLFENVSKLAKDFERFEVQWIPRELNKHADALSTKPFRAEATPGVVGLKLKETAVGSSPSKREHDILCPKCRKPCTLTLERDASGKERIRQACPEHGFVCWAPMVEPFLTLARKSM